MNEVPQPYQGKDQFQIHLPTAHKTESLVVASSVFDLSTIDALCRERQVVINSPDVNTIYSLMTPSFVLSQNTHEREIILPVRYPSFDALREQRDRIRDLKLVPKRSDGVQEDYLRLDKTFFLSLVRNHYLRNSPVSFVKELYPTDLPPDVRQSVIWINEQMVDNRQVAEFIAKIVKLLRLTQDDVILFERSRTTETDYVKVAIPEYRHIHMWTRYQGEEIFL